MKNSPRRVSLLVASSLALSLASCSATHDRFQGTGKTIDVSVKSVTLRSGKLGSSIDFTDISVKPKKGTCPCKVKVWVQVDRNGDGVIGNGERRLVYENPDKFHGFSKRRFSIRVQEQVQSATLVVEASDCSHPLSPPEHHLFGIDRDGVTRLAPSRPNSYIIAGGQAREHFVEIRPYGNGSLELSVGDLRARGGLLAKLARQTKPDFLAALLIVDKLPVAVLAGKDLVTVRLPKFSGRLRHVRILTFDHSLNLCGDWDLQNLR